MPLSHSLTICSRIAGAVPALREAYMADEFYRDLHKQEFDRREALSSRGNGILAGLTTLAGALAFLAVGFKGTAPVLQLIFWALLGAAGLSVLIAGGLLLASYLVATRPKPHPVPGRRAPTLPVPPRWEGD